MCIYLFCFSNTNPFNTAWIVVLIVSLGTHLGSPAASPDLLCCVRGSPPGFSFSDNCDLLELR